MIEIDGSWGEGGGQILRSALTLSVLTGRPVRIVDIRAGRRKPGLMAQHLQAVKAAAAVSQARVDGAHPASMTLVFEPRGIYPGAYRFDIGTAGSTSLVLQTVLLPLSAAQRESSLIITGGTHVAWSPCFHYLELLWLPYLRRIGLEAELTMSRAGFYPRGGGAIRAVIHPALSKTPLQLTERGCLKKIRCLSGVANLDLGIAERQSRRARERLTVCGVPPITEHLSLSATGKGTMLLLLAEFEHSRCCYYALGERGKPAVKVADEAVEPLLTFLETKATIDEYLADQLLLPLALTAGRSELRPVRVTRHLLTNVWVVRQFLPVSIDVEGEVGTPGIVRVEGVSLEAGGGYGRF